MINALIAGTRRSVTAVSRTNLFRIPQSARTLPAIRSFSDGGDESERQKGNVKWFDSVKGFGFIVPEAEGPDVFVHQTAIHANGFRSLGEGEPVEFDLVEEDNGKMRAIGVTGPDGAYVQGAPRRMDGGRRDDGYDGGFGGGGGGDSYRY